jgi:hypothetical protein
MRSPSIDILVPTVRRPQALVPLMDSIRSTSPLGTYKVTFITDPGDERTKEVIQGQVAGRDVDRLEHGGTFPVKINAGVAATEAPSILCCGDDVLFKYGWWEAVEEKLGEYGVIGTNDLTPRTVDKDHATAQIVSREYIEERGAAFREPGHIFHEGYDHNFADDELCKLAQMRDTWIFLPECMIEHRHPFWGTAEMDPIYEKGGLKYHDDRRLFKRRRRGWIRAEHKRQ